MPLVTVNPTANETPDSTQGGSAVTGAINTGHASTTSARVGGGATDKTCRWTTFPSAPGVTTSILLKVDWSEDGTIVAGGSNLFQLAYSINGGGAWTVFLSHPNVTGVNNGTAQATLATTNITQVQVRDLLRASGTTGGDSATVTVAISNVRAEVTTGGVAVVVML